MQRLGKDIREKMNRLLYEEVTSDKTIVFLAPGTLEAESAWVIWKEIRKEIEEIAKENHFHSRLLATMDFTKKNAMTFIYYKDMCNMYKSYMVGQSVNCYKVFLALAWIMSEYGIEVVPTNRFSNQSEHKWGIEFTRH